MAAVVEQNGVSPASWRPWREACESAVTYCLQASLASLCGPGENIQGTGQAPASAEVVYDHVSAGISRAHGVFGRR